ncbi:MAG: chemotaxis protein CheW [Guyparkeria sp.]
MAEGAPAFAHLRSLAERAARSAAGLPREGKVIETWQGVVYRIGNQLLVSPLDEVAAIVPVPRIVPLPGVVPSLLGLCNLRGELIGVHDLGLQLFGRATVVDRRTVMLVVRCAEDVAALLVDRSIGIRRFPVDERIDTPVDLPHVDHAVDFEAEPVPVLSLKALVEGPAFNAVVA